MRYGIMVACIGLLACGGGVEPSRDGGAASEEAAPSASEVPAREASPEARPAVPEAEATRAAGPGAAAGYQIRDFEPLGTGRLVVSGLEYPFSVAECHLEDRELSSGWIQDVYVLGAGELDGRPFFVEVKRGRDPRKKRVKTASITLHFTPLPALYAHEMPTQPAVLEMLEKVQGVDSLRSMGPGAVAYDDLVVSGSTVATDREVSFMSFAGGGLEGPAGKGTLELTCAE